MMSNKPLSRLPLACLLATAAFAAQAQDPVQAPASAASATESKPICTADKASLPSGTGLTGTAVFEATVVIKDKRIESSDVVLKEGRVASAKDRRAFVESVMTAVRGAKCTGDGTFKQSFTFTRN